jgi:regulatory protein
MGKMTNIIPQKKDPKRVNIFVDGEFAFGISVETKFVKKIKIGQELSEKRVNELIWSDQVERLLNKSLKFLSFRPRTEKEVREYLLRKGKLKDIENSDVEGEQYKKSVEKVIDKLKKLKQINDREFAEWLLEQRSKFRQRGNRLIKIELLQKGVDKKIIEELPFKDKTGEEELAMKAASKKYPSYKKLNQKDSKIKMSQYLARRGFSWDVIKKTVDTLWAKEVK